MQNFTLGKRGIPMLLFALILLTTSFSTFGQENCPTVTRDDNPEATGIQQEFCYLSTVADLTATANGDTVRWYRSETSSNPIPQNELLQTATYFAGNQSGTCTARIAVSVIVDDAGAPEPDFGNIFSPCIYGPETNDPNADYLPTIAELIENIAGNEVEIYAEEFGGDEIDGDVRLVRGNSYFAGQRSTEGCPTSRVAIRFDPIYAPAPEADDQIFCEGATVADLVAVATSENTRGFRWYSTIDSQPALDAATPLIDGETYYVSQIVNRIGRDLPPCESEDRAAVTVSVQDEGPFVGEPNSDEICYALADSAPNVTTVREYYLGLLDEGVSTQGTFDPTIESIVEGFNDNPIGDFSTTYTVTEGDCSNSVLLSVTVTEEIPADAGTIADQEVCESNTSVDLTQYLTGSSMIGGTFNGTGVNEEGFFDPSIGEGTYEITYTVDDSEPCVTGEDSAEFLITVLPAPFSEDINEEFCIVDARELIGNPAAALAYFQDLLEGENININPLNFIGNPLDEANRLLDYLEEPGDSSSDIFTVTYRNESESDLCEDAEIAINITINNIQSATVDGIDDFEVCSSTQALNLYDHLELTGGTFLMGETVLENGLLDISEIGDALTITYSVNEDQDETDCIEGSGETTFNVTVVPGIDLGGPVTAEICYALADTAPDHPTVRNYLIDLLNPGVPRDGTFNPTVRSIISDFNENSIREFSTTYTVQQGDCIDSVVININVTDEEPANAGTIADQNLCSTEASVDLNNYLTDSGGMTGGTFSGEGVDEEGEVFDPSIGAGTYEITYSIDESSSDCIIGEASTTFIITVTEGQYAGEDLDLVFCTSEIEALMANPAEALSFFDDLLENQEGEVDMDGEFDTNIEDVLNYYTTGDFTQPFTTTYTVSNENCESQAVITITINEVEQVEVGVIDDLEVCSSNTQLNLFTYLGVSVGTFSTEDGEIDGGLLDISTVRDLGAITYSVNEDEDETDCIEGSGETTFNVTVVPGIDLGGPVTAEICYALADTAPDHPTVRNYLLDLLNPGVPRDGTFNPTVRSIISDFNDNPIREFSTTYTVQQGDCIDSVVININVTDEEPANAGTIADQNLCSTEASVDLNTYLTGSGGMTGGTFSGEGVDEEGVFNPSIGTGTYEITYSIDESSSDCIIGEASTTFIITVTEGPFAGNDVNLEYCLAEIEAMTEAEVLALFNDWMTDDVMPGGEFTNSIESLIAQFSANPVGTFTTTYTVTEGDCEASAEFSLVVNDTVPAEVDEIEDFEVCTSQDQLNLFDELGLTGGVFSNESGVIVDGLIDITTAGVLPAITYTLSEDDNECVIGSASTTFNVTVTEGPFAGTDVSLEYCLAEIEAMTEAEVLAIFNNWMTDDVTPGGDFTNSIESLIAQFTANPVGTFSTTYTVTEGDCEDSATFSLVVNETVPAEVDEIEDFEVCMSQDQLNLYDELGLTGGVFSFGTEEIEGGLIDITTAGALSAITYTLSEDNNECVIGSASTTFNVTVTEGPFAGTDVNLEYCLADIEAMTEAEVLALFNDWMTEDVTSGGEFTNSIESLIAQFTANPVGTFTTTYTVSEGDCEASATFSLVVNETVPAEVDEIEDIEVCMSQEQLNLFDELGLSGGVFSNESGVIVDGLIDITTAGALPAITYTLSEDDNECVSGSASTTFNVTVTEGPFIGEPVSIEVCNTIVEVIGSNPVQTVRNFYLDLLDEGVDRDGTFNPTIEEIIARYDQNHFQDFTTTYTLTNGDCVSTVELTATVLEPQTASVDPIEDFTVCLSEESLDLYSELNLTGGTFSTESGEIVNGLLDISTPGVQPTITYTISSELTDCVTGTASESFVITVGGTGEAPEAEAEQVFCSVDNPTIADLQITGDDILIYSDAELTTEVSSSDPLVDGTVYYAVSACGSEATAITAIVQQVATAPVADTEQIFCLVNESTVADLVATGDGELTWYTDAALTTPAASTDALLDGTVYYVVSSTGESACEISEAVMVTVVITDSESPTISTDGNEFCRQDNPTVQELVNNLSGTGIQIYTSATGGTALSPTTALENDVTYYATATDPASGCESSERRAIIVEVEFCGIPEGFSPNGDGINDRFVIEDIAEDYPNYTIEIFNRWGNAVFKGNASTPDWDGVSNQSSTLGDNVLPAGVYFYIVNYNDGSTPPAQGKLYLSR